MGNYFKTNREEAKLDSRREDTQGSEEDSVDLHDYQPAFQVDHKPTIARDYLERRAEMADYR